MADFLILITLIILNGIFSMSELAILSARKTRLEELADKGSYQARIALQLAREPSRFLATVQVGITLIGVAAGAFGGAVLGDYVANLIAEAFSLDIAAAQQISFALIIGGTTYLSLVIGELVPKRIALGNPEQIALLVAVPMNIIARIVAPLVFVLSKSTEGLLRLLGLHAPENSNDLITDYEIIAMIQEGIQSGDFEVTEHEMVKGALELDDTRIQKILTPRTSIDWIDIHASTDDIRQILQEHPHSVYPVCDGSIDDVVGIIQTIDLVQTMLQEQPLNLRSLARNPLYLPETLYALPALQQLKQTKSHLGLVLGEHGGIEGLITINDIIEEIIGDINTDAAKAVSRKDNSLLVDGTYSIDDLEDLLPGFQVPEDEKHDYSTLAGFTLHRLQRVPQATDTFTWLDYTFEVIDMDGNRIDKILITHSDSPSATD